MNQSLPVSIDSSTEKRTEKRIVLLGASNLVRSIATVIETSRGIWGTPADTLVAAGHGRSYGRDSRVLGRKLPGIVHCGIWTALERRPPASSAALVTDIGNDLVYGVAVEQIVRWIEFCVRRLVTSQAHVVLTELPIASMNRLEGWKYRLLRNLLFPQCRLSLELVRQRANELNDCLIELAQRHQLRIVRPRLEWYGFDPIHIRYRARGVAWREIMGHWRPNLSNDGRFLGSLHTWYRLRRMRPLERTLFGIRQVHHQPCGTLPDGSPISLF